MSLDEGALRPLVIAAVVLLAVALSSPLELRSS
jgi:hypothetical protein